MISLYKFIRSALANLTKDNIVLLFGILAFAYLALIYRSNKNNEIRDLKENGGVIISADIIDKLPSQKSNQQFRAAFTKDNWETDIKLMDVSVKDFKVKQTGDTILLLFSPTCNSTGIAYDLYPSKSDIKKCLNGCEFVYGKKGLIEKGRKN